jgi:outer membrane protein assembly factor BamA
VRNRYDDFDEETFAASVGAGTYLGGERWRASTVASYVSLVSDEPDKTSSPDNHDRIHGLGMQLGYDTRDLYRNPRRGQLHGAGVTWFGHALGGTVHYTQLTLDARRYQPLPWGRTLALGARWIRQTGEVPTYRQVRLGGASTLRGYPDGALEGDHGLLASAEWRIDLVAPRSHDLWLVDNIDLGLAAGVFADAGATWGRGATGSPDPLTWSDVRTSGGVGLRFLVPWVEVARLDLAITESGRVGLAVGQGMKF